MRSSFPPPPPPLESGSSVTIVIAIGYWHSSSPLLGPDGPEMKFTTVPGTEHRYRSPDVRYSARVVVEIIIMIAINSSQQQITDQTAEH
ncbi:hypothetical protein ZHAS_00006334 [Anopheles sinensis]|uniref:Uncharacterized protein n=1 Tax=Anopheles sinensis TaxID=74873 RepID=A0A084VLK2_ANOSI|nr:hypothetical protein ZHAS_00006334 [Anopheles sinensis]